MLIKVTIINEFRMDNCLLNTSVQTLCFRTSSQRVHIQEVTSRIFKKAILHFSNLFRVKINPANPGTHLILFYESAYFDES